MLHTEAVQPEVPPPAPLDWLLGIQSTSAVEVEAVGQTGADRQWEPCLRGSRRESVVSEKPERVIEPISESPHAFARPPVLDLREFVVEWRAARPAPSSSLPSVR